MDQLENEVRSSLRNPYFFQLIHSLDLVDPKHKSTDRSSIVQSINQPSLAEGSWQTSILAYTRFRSLYHLFASASLLTLVAVNRFSFHCFFNPVNNPNKK